MLLPLLASWKSEKKGVRDVQDIAPRVLMSRRKGLHLNFCQRRRGQTCFAR